MLERNRMRFESVEEAMSEGYRACKVCRPTGDLEAGPAGAAPGTAGR